MKGPRWLRRVCLDPSGPRPQPALSSFRGNHPRLSGKELNASSHSGQSSLVSDSWRLNSSPHSSQALRAKAPPLPRVGADTGRAWFRSLWSSGMARNSCSSQSRGLLWPIEARGAAQPVRWLLGQAGARGKALPTFKMPMEMMSFKQMATSFAYVTNTGAFVVDLQLPLGDKYHP